MYPNSQNYRLYAHSQISTVLDVHKSVINSQLRLHTLFDHLCNFEANIEVRVRSQLCLFSISMSTVNLIIIIIMQSLSARQILYWHKRRQLMQLVRFFIEYIVQLLRRVIILLQPTGQTRHRNKVKSKYKKVKKGNTERFP